MELEKERKEIVFKRAEIDKPMAVDTGFKVNNILKNAREGQ